MHGFLLVAARLNALILPYGAVPRWAVVGTGPGGGRWEYRPCRGGVEE
ncbi:hypothetical protein [Actinoalloteichus caeruleus]